MNNIHPGAMPWHHRYIGNPLLSGFLNLLFRTGVDDAHCGMRAFRRDALERLDLRTTGMEFASEMVIRAAKARLCVRQLEIEYFPRGGASKLASFKDGWRHVRFLLVHSPNHLFILPGAVMAVFGAAIELVVVTHLPVFGRAWDIHALIGGGLLAIVGTQVVRLGVCARTYAAYFMDERDACSDGARALPARAWAAARRCDRLRGRGGVRVDRDRLARSRPRTLGTTSSRCWGRRSWSSASRSSSPRSCCRSWGCAADVSPGSRTS